jgi:hypothetical protein
MLYAPLGILQILRFAKSSNSRFTATLLATDSYRYLTGPRSCSIQCFLNDNLFRSLERLKRVLNYSYFFNKNA